MEPYELKKGSYSISTNKSRLDVKVIHDFLKSSYWAEGIPIEIVKKSIEGSICFGVYDGEKQIGFARVITDQATFAYLADVFIVEEHRGQGHSVWLMEAITSHPELKGLRRWLLGTRDAHGLYKKFQFTELPNPQRFMQLFNPEVYSKS